MTVAQSICSGDRGVSASLLRPAEQASMPGQRLNSASAVGLRSLFWEQMKSARIIG
jgi:hypothetical protein